MIGIDTNVLVYAEGLNEGIRQEQAGQIVQAALAVGATVPAQVLAELFRVLVRKGRLRIDESRVRADRYAKNAVLAPTTLTTLSTAFDLAAEHDLQIFDAIIPAASAEAGCSLLSEDMHDGFVWRDVTVANPFAQTPHPMIAGLLRGSTPYGRGVAP